MNEVEELTNDWEDFKKAIDEQIKQLDIANKNLYISYIDVSYNKIVVEKIEEDNITIHIY